MTTNTIAIVIPTLNEEEALRHLLPELPRRGGSGAEWGELAGGEIKGPWVARVSISSSSMESLVRWIIVVDNNSTDATASVAHAAGVTVVSESLRGYGQACWRGFQAAREAGADIVIFMDGDGSDDPADLPLMLAPVLKGEADLVIGSRVSKRAEAGAIPPQARLGNWLVSRLISQLYGVQLHDVGSFRVMKCTALEALQMRERTFGWPVEMLVKAARAGYRIVEVPIHYRRRSHGRSKVAGTLVGSVKAAYYMLSTTLRYAGTRRNYV